MPGNSPSVAFQEFIEPIRRTVSCITNDPVIVSPGGRYDTSGVRSIGLASGEPIILSAEGHGVMLELGLLYQTVENPDPNGKKFKVRTRGYAYTFRDLDENVILSYHWHPLGEDGFHDPHLHVADTKPHYPSPRISLEHVVRSAITEFGAECLRGDWEKVLTINHSVFTLYNSWRDADEMAKANEAYDAPRQRARRSKAAGQQK